MDGVQEAAEALGNFISALGKFGKEWFIDFLGQIMDQVVDAGEGVTNLAAEIGSFPDGLGGDDVIGGVLKDLTDIVTGLFEVPSAVQAGPSEYGCLPQRHFDPY